MQGQQYPYRVTAGPFRGRLCRIIEAQRPELPDYLKLKIQGEKFLFILPLSHVAPRNGRSHRRPRK